MSSEIQIDGKRALRRRLIPRRIFERHIGIRRTV